MSYFKTRRSQTCFRRGASRRPLSEYWSRPEAEAAARRTTQRTGRRFAARRCHRCPRYHIAPVPEYCPCCRGRDGEPKQLYRTEHDAEMVAVARGGGLDVYPCPSGERGFHLTKSQG